MYPLGGRAYIQQKNDTKAPYHDVQSVFRNMGPGTIALDEITAKEDCDSLLDAAWCGVDLIATAHAGSKKELLERRIYKPLIETKLFETLIVLKEDKSWTMERM